MFFVLVFLTAGCNQSGSPSDTPTTGTLKIISDEAFYPLMDTQVFSFNSIYSYADVKVQYKTEAECFNELMNDSVRLIVSSRSFHKEELEEFNKWEIVPKITKIAYDAVAVITNKSQKDSSISLNELKDLLTGKKVNGFENAKVVFDNNGSGIITYLNNKLGIINLSENCFALNSNSSVIDYISFNKNCLGLIGVNWISDKDDSTHMNFLNEIKVIEVSETDSSETFKPYQAYIAQKKYPLYREVFLLSREAYTGLATGFTAFVASERGQRIILKQGLVPATMPVRLVEFVEDDEL